MVDESVDAYLGELNFSIKIKVQDSSCFLSTCFILGEDWYICIIEGGKFI